jgi:YbbR domain-containing protein
MHWMSKYLQALKEYGRDYVLENPGLKVLALLITGVLWLSVASRPVSQISLNNIPVEFLNQNEPNLIVSKQNTTTARVYLEGPREAIDSLREGQFTATADLSDIEPGVRVIPLKIEPNRLPTNVRVKEIEPRTIRVTVERATEKEVPITPRWEGEPPSGYEVIDWKIVPITVKISGAESQIREITEVSTETVRLTDKTGPFNATVAIDIGSPNLNISEDSRRKVMLIVNIGEVQKERTVDNVPVMLIGAATRAVAVPKFVKVTVRGTRSALEELSASDISVAVEYRGGSRIFTPKVTISPGLADRVAVRSVEPETVRIR